MATALLMVMGVADDVDVDDDDAVNVAALGPLASSLRGGEGES